MTLCEKIEIDLLFSAYRVALRGELDLFLSAFIAKNHIYPTDGKKVDTEALSINERLKTERMFAMMVGIDRTVVRRAIGE